MSDEKSTSEDYLHCLIEEITECMYRKEDEKGRRYRQCGMCAIANNAMSLDLHILTDDNKFPDWHEINKIKLYEDNPNLNYMKGIFKIANKHYKEMKQHESVLESKKTEMRSLFLSENKK